MRKAIISAMLPALCLMACTQKPYETETSLTAVRITAGVATRASDNTWDSGDEIGVMVTAAPVASSLPATCRNVEYTADSGGASTDFTAVGSGIWFDASGTFTFTAYYPYQSGDASEYPGTDGVVTLSTSDQSSGQSALDFLYAPAQTASASNPEVSFTFAHVMSRIVINLVGGSGISSDDVADGTFTLTGLVHDGEVCVCGENAGETSVTGTADETPWSLDDYGCEETPATGYDIAFSAILFPQELTALTFSATVGNVTLSADLAGYTDNVYEAGCSYTYNISVSEAGLDVRESTISAWVPDDEENVDLDY